MNSSKKKQIGLIAGILLILAVPILFFQLMGGSLFHKDGNQKRIIAIVNEDLGDAKDGESIEMGKEVVSILSEDSPYEWKVMGRGTATNGLKSRQYEAIVYIPSDFSENIMTYDQQNPKKAEFSYQVQRQKNGSQKEKALREIDKATNRVNEKISTLYWSYVALEMDHIKKEFTNILDKETEFLDVMSTYYKPGSEALAVKMKQQKEGMEELRSSIGDANGSHESRIQDTDSFGEQLNEFVTYVEQYKGFQRQQKEILLQMQNNSLEKIQNTAASQMQRFNESALALKANNEELNTKINEVNNVIDENKAKFDALSELRKQQVDRQVKELLAVQGAAIDRYNETILKNLEKSIADGKNGSDQTAPGGVDGLPHQKEWKAIRDSMSIKSQEKSGRTLPEMMDEQQKITELLTELVALKTIVGDDEIGTQISSEITQLETKLQDVKTSIASKNKSWSGVSSVDVTDYKTATSEFGDLYENYEALNGKYQSVQSILKNNSPDQASLLSEIKMKESSLLNHAALSADKKRQLEKLFNQGPANSKTSSLMTYYSKLQQFGFTLDERNQGAQRDELLKDQILTTLLESIVDIREEELEGWNSVGNGIPEAELGMSNLSSTFAAIMSGYETTMEEQHVELQNDLDSLNNQANTLLTHLNSTEGEPVQTVGEGQVIAGQQNVGTQLVSLSSLMTSLSERQNGLVNYAVDLYGKANDIKDTSTVFSDKWETNINAMSTFKGDIQSFLANTYVDGQENGYAFNHFVNPLELKGEATTTEEAKKVPPVILFIILLISSLLIGFFIHRYKTSTPWMNFGLIAFLSLLVGLIISLYSVNMYILRDDRAIEWTIFTILLLLAGAALIGAALDFGQTTGWLAGIVLMCIYISPLLILGVPDIKIPDILSEVYNSIKYEPETQFIWGIIITAIAAAVMLVISYFLNRNREVETSMVE